MKILGIDCSSTTIGISIIEVIGSHIKFIDCDYIKPIKSDDIILRLADTREQLNNKIKKYAPDEIAIEEIVSYMPGRSSANTILTLAVFNRMAGLAAYDYLKKSPYMYGVINIRHGIKLSKEFPQKEEIPNILEKHLNFAFPWRLNKKKNKIIENYDMADAIAVALFHAFIKTGKCVKPLTIKERKEKKKISRAKKKAKQK